MKIEVRLFATLAGYLPDEGDGQSATLELADDKIGRASCRERVYVLV